MAKGTLHLNVEFSAVTDDEGKFGRLATLLGLADADHALGRCLHLWLACTRRGESELPQWLVERVLGERGPEALVEAELASWAGGRGDSATRRMRIAGAEKHCLWMASDQVAKRGQSSKGGKIRAATASRAGGRFTSDSPAQTSPSEISSESEIPDQNSLSLARAIPLPGDGGEPGLTPRHHATQQGAATPGQSASSAAGNVAEPPSGQAPDLSDRPPSPGTLSPRLAPPASVPAVSPPEAPRGDIAGTYDPEDARARGRLAERFYREVSDERIKLAAELRLPAPLPFPAITPSSERRALVELRARIREEGALAPAVCERILAHLVSDARAKRTLDWLSEKSFLSGAWETARNGGPPRRDPARTGSAAAAPAVPPSRRDHGERPIVLPPEKRVGPAEREASERALRAWEAGDQAALEALKATLAGAPRAPPAVAQGTSKRASSDEEPRSKAT